MHGNLQANTFSIEKVLRISTPVTSRKVDFVHDNGRYGNNSRLVKVIYCVLCLLVDEAGKSRGVDFLRKTIDHCSVEYKLGNVGIYLRYHGKITRN